MNIHALGHTRSARHSDHLLQTPDTFVRAPLTDMAGATAVLHAAPALGAQFHEYTAEFEAGGLLDASPMQRFVFVLEGTVNAGGRALSAGGFAWFPPGLGKVTAAETARVLAIEKSYVPRAGTTMPAAAVFGSERSVTPAPLMGDADIEVRTLVPTDPAFDMAVNTMTFQPGASLPMVEVHVMEHGLLMLEGSGIYRLGDRWYPVTAGDFIWMAPYLPQWFGALGKTPAKYLIYKDWNR